MSETAIAPEVIDVAPVATPVTTAEPRKTSRKELVGEVVSNKMAKTIVVQVTRRVPHAKFKKIIRVSNKFYAHDDKSVAQIGDTVRIQESRPISRLKRWVLLEVVKH